MAGFQSLNKGVLCSRLEILLHEVEKKNIYYPILDVPAEQQGLDDFVLCVFTEPQC